MFGGGRVTSERGQASPLKCDLVVTPLCFLLPCNSQSFVPTTENQHRHLPISQLFSKPSKIACIAMEKSWLYFKAEFELGEDWQLYSWKLLMESTTETGSKEMQLKALTFGVPIPGLSSEAGKLFFVKYQPMWQDWERPHPWKYSRTGWTGSWATWPSGWHSSQQGDWK